MSRSTDLTELIKKVTHSPLKYQPDYRAQTDFPIKQVDIEKVSDDLLHLFKKFSYPGIALHEIHMLTSGRPENIEKVKNKGRLLGRRKTFACYVFNGDLVFIDGRNVYSPSQKTLVYLTLCQ